MTTGIKNPYPGVALPEGARAFEWWPGWQWDDDEPRAFRMIYGSEHRVAEAAVYVRAFQFSDGSFATGRNGPVVIAKSGDDGLNCEEAGEFAQAVTEAAAQLARWQGRIT